jgi:lipoprotein-anchoring transpeptidase ErfK/SrfK
MAEPTRRFFLAGSGVAAAFSLAGCNTTQPTPTLQAAALTVAPAEPEQGLVDESVGGPARYRALYGAVSDKFPIAGLKPGVVKEAYWRQDIDYRTSEPPGTIVVDPHAHYLYHVRAGGKATRYGVGVGREGFGWKGVATINSKQEWPDWYPPKEMIDRQPEIKKVMSKLQSGLGMPGGLHNPLGARAMYLWQNNKDTLFRIHGTLEPGTIGSNVSSGCIRMVNQDAIHLYSQTDVGTRVVVL